MPARGLGLGPCQSKYIPKRPVPRPVPTQLLLVICITSVAGPFIAAKYFLVFMVLSQQVSLGVPSCCYKTPLPVPQLAHGVGRDLRRNLPQQTIKSGDHIRPMKQLPALT